MKNVACVILAAGKGKRMKSDLPKVLHLLNDKPLITHVLTTCRSAGVGRIVIVVGFKGELVAREAKAFTSEIVEQTQLLGTGHAVAQTEFLLRDFSGELVVMNGDMPRIRPASLSALVMEHRRRQAAATILTAELADPSGYGRVLRRADGLVDRIVEDADADEQIRRIREINTGMFCFSPTYLFTALREVNNQNEQGEYYLPDVLPLLRRDGHVVAAQKVEDPTEGLGVNSLEQLKQMARLSVRD